MTTNLNPHPSSPAKQLRRSDDRIVAGVCSGIAEYLGVDTTLVRVIVAVLTVFGGSGILIYLIAWLVMPDSSGTVLAGRVIPRSAQRSTSHEPPAA